MALANLLGLPRPARALAVVPPRNLIPRRPSAVRGWDPTDTGDQFAGWIGTQGSGDEEARGRLDLERARMRELETSNPWVERYLALFLINVIGHTGIKLVPRVMRTEQAPVEEGEEPETRLVPDTDANEKLRAAWLAWGKAGICTVDGRHSWLGVVSLLARSWKRDGESLLRKYRGGAFGPFGFQVQPLEGDHLPILLSKELEGGRRIHMGIERDEFDRPLAYWLARKHPGDRGFRIGSGLALEHFERIPANEIVHLYDPKRISQTRGLPQLESAVAGLNMMQGYEEAEVVAARASSAKMGFILPEEGAGGYQGSGEATLTETEIVESLQPGTIEILGKGDKFEGFDPQHPTTAFAPFLKHLLRRFAGATGGAGYPSLANDLERVNLSSLRSARLEERDFWKRDQQHIVDKVLENVYPDWLAQAFLVPGLLELPVLDSARFFARSWQGRRWEWIDPLKQAQGNEIELDNLTTSLTEILADKGRTPRELFEEIAAETDLAESFDLADLLPYLQPRRGTAPGEAPDAPSGDPSPEPAAGEDD